MGYDLDKDYLVEDYGAESFEDFKRILVGDGWFRGDIGYMEGLEEYYEEYLEDFTGDNPESFEDFQERILRVDYENEDFKRIIFGAEPDTVRFKVGERYTPRYYHGYGHSDIEIIRRTDKSVFVAQVDAKGNAAGNTLRYKIHTTPAVDMGGDRFPAQEYYKLTHGQPVRAGDTTKKAESFGAEAIPIRHSRRLNGYYAIKGYEDASEDGFIYRIYRAPDTNDWFKAMVYDDNAMKDNFRKPTSRRLNPSGEMVISNDPPSLLIGAFPKLEDAKRALVFRMIQDGNYHQMITDGNLKWLLKGYYPESFSAEECVSCNTPDGYWRGLPLCASSGEELCISCCACNMCRSKWNMLEVGEQKAESFRSYKVAPDLSSYTKAELVSSIAGPQGTAAYDEVVYDPLAQSRLSAESIDSFSPARLIILGASIGVALGLYNTRGE